MNFELIDLVVWNGIITYYSIIKGKVNDSEIELANDIDIENYSKNI